MLRSTTQKDITWFPMPARMNSCHILGTRIVTVIMHNNSNSLWLKVNKLKYKVLRLRLRLRLKSSRDRKLLA